MISITKDNLDKEMMNSDKPIIIDFSADWCYPCKEMSLIFEELSKEIKDIKFVKIDVEEEPNLAVQFNVMSIPTFMIINKGDEVDRISGSMPKAIFKAKIQDILKRI